MMAVTISPESITDLFRASMRIPAASVSLVTAKDRAGSFHGMAVTSAISLSMDPPSMLVAVNRSASVHPVISDTGKFCLNLMSETHLELLECFSRSALRDRRFAREHWQEGPEGLPILRGALASQICTVEAAQDYGTHTIFIGKVDHVLLPAPTEEQVAPLVWMNGSRTLLANCQPARS
jgi:flavin reductase (DIM6/NTAB) family NADH-FMN oxidoreductase RutF